MNSWKEYLGSEEMIEKFSEMVCLKQEIERNGENMARIMMLLSAMEFDVVEGEEMNEKMVLDTMTSLRQYLIYTLKKHKDLHLKHFEQLVELGEKKYKMLHSKEYGLKDMQEALIKSGEEMKLVNGFNLIEEFNKKWKEKILKSSSDVKIDVDD